MKKSPDASEKVDKEVGSTKAVVQAEVTGREWSDLACVSGEEALKPGGGERLKAGLRPEWGRVNLLVGVASRARGLGEALSLSLQWKLRGQLPSLVQRCHRTFSSPDGKGGVSSDIYEMSLPHLVLPWAESLFGNKMTPKSQALHPHNKTFQNEQGLPSLTHWSEIPAFKTTELDLSCNFS